MTKWLTIIGMGEDGLDGLSPRARLVLANADLIVGSKRLLALVGETKAERHEWPQPFSAVIDRIRPLRGRCLKKDARARMRDIGEARLQIDDSLSGDGVSDAMSQPWPTSVM